MQRLSVHRDSLGYNDPPRADSFDCNCSIDCDYFDFIDSDDLLFLSSLFLVHLQVAVRVRPVNDNEIESGCTDIAHVIDVENVRILSSISDIKSDAVSSERTFGIF